MTVGDVFLEVIFLNVHEELDRLCLTPDNLKTQKAHWRNSINILVNNNNNMQMANW